MLVNTPINVTPQIVESNRVLFRIHLKIHPGEIASTDKEAGKMLYCVMAKFDAFESSEHFILPVNYVRQCQSEIHCDILLNNPQ